MSDEHKLRVIERLVSYRDGVADAASRRLLADALDLLTGSLEPHQQAPAVAVRAA